MRGIERYFYNPSFAQKLIAFVLLPVSLFYAVIATIRRKLSKFEDFDIPIVSVGNIVLGGSGKSPFIIEIAKDYPDSCVILRGYGRKSKGMKLVGRKGEILLGVKDAGDEAIMLSKALPNSYVIVSKKRQEAILEAKKLGAKIVFLDDGFRFNFKKLNIVLKPKLEPYFNFCIPSGGYREVKSSYKDADIVLKEGIDYDRHVELLNQTERMLFLTAIANPSRLDSYLPNVVGKITLRDHSFFDKEEIISKYNSLNATSLLVTQKDLPKLEGFGLPLSILQLNLKVSSSIKEKIRSYIESYK